MPRMATGKRAASRRKASAKAEVLDTEQTLAEVALGEFPVLPVRNTVLLPNMVVPLFVGRDSSLRAIEEAMAGLHVVIVVAQKDDSIEEPGPDDLYQVGTEGVIGRVLKMPDGTTNVLVQGQRRVRLERVLRSGIYLRAKVEPIEEEVEKTPAIEALMRATLAIFDKCIKLSRSLDR